MDPSIRPTMAPPIVGAPLIQLLAGSFEPYRDFLLSCEKVASFLHTVDGALMDLLDFYNPTLPASKRVSAHWPLMRPTDLVIVVFTYLAFVAIAAGARFLPALLGANQKSTHMNTLVPEPSKKGATAKPSLAEKLSFMLFVQIVYNLFQVITCSYVVYKAMAVCIGEGYTLAFNKFDPARENMAEVVWLFYLTKVIDLLDTVFIVFRRKWSQFSFLHIYHHASILYMMWINASVGYDGDIYFAVIANGTIHVMMYTYYLMASLNMEAAGRIKQCITRMQMTQFLGMLAQGFYHVCFYSSCEYPLRIAVGYMAYIVSMYILFARFAKRTYGAHNSAKKSQRISDAHEQKRAVGVD